MSGYTVNGNLNVIGGSISADNGLLLTGGQISVAEKSVVFASTVTLDWSTGNNQVIGILTGDITINQSNPQSGGEYSVYVLQNGAGGHTTTFSADFAFGSVSGAGAAGSGAAQATLWTFRYHSAASILLCTGRVVY